MPLEPSLAETIDRGIQSALGDVYTSASGVVVAFDPDTCTADVQLTTKRVTPKSAEEDTTETLPILPGIRVMYLQAAAGRVRLGLAAGDPVAVFFLMYSDTQYRVNGEVPSAPLDTRRHSIASGFCLPGLLSDKNVEPLTVPDGIEITSATGPVVVTAARLEMSAPQVRAFSADVRLGIDNEADTHDQFVALADKVDAALANIKTKLAVPVAVPAGGGSVSFSLGTQPSVAAARVKAR